MARVKTVNHGLENLSYIGSKFWGSIPSHMKEIDSIIEFKHVIKIWKPDLSFCRLCKVYLLNTGYSQQNDNNNSNNDNNNNNNNNINNNINNSNNNNNNNNINNNINNSNNNNNNNNNNIYVYMYAKIYICLRKSEYHNRFSSLLYVYIYFSLFGYLLESMKFI